MTVNHLDRINVIMTHKPNKAVLVKTIQDLLGLKPFPFLKMIEYIRI